MKNNHGIKTKQRNISNRSIKTVEHVIILNGRGKRRDADLFWEPDRNPYKDERPIQVEFELIQKKFGKNLLELFEIDFRSENKTLTHFSINKSTYPRSKSLCVPIEYYSMYTLGKSVLISEIFTPLDSVLFFHDN